MFLQVDAAAWVDAFNRWALLRALALAGLLGFIDGSIKCTSVGGNSSA
ncbi:MAG: hypothetical protein LH702_15770 [Phormidesmis sp. CAN_BIN44]|nr:hypothetical protein [Phormidesmis sp. CAN_BIN44]